MLRLSACGSGWSTARMLVMAAAAFVSLGVWTTTAPFVSTAAVWAQDGDEPAAQPAAAPGGAAAAPAPPKESFLAWMIRASGIFGFLIFGLSFLLVALLTMDSLQLRRVNYLPYDFLEQFEQKLNARDFQGAYELAKGSDSCIGRILSAGMARLSKGYDEAVKGMEEVTEEEMMAMEHKLTYLALIGSIAPMLGLLGTVQGMIMSFQVIANSVTSPKPSELADGVATALFTTLEGLIVCIPAIVGFTLFKNMLARYGFECSIVSEGLMSRFQSVGKPAAAPAPAPAAGARPAAAAQA